MKRPDKNQVANFEGTLGNFSELSGNFLTFTLIFIIIIAMFINKNAILKKVLILSFILWACLAFHNEAFAASGPDIAMFFYKPSCLEKFSPEKTDFSLKGLELILPEAFSAVSVLNKLPSVVKDGAKDGVKSFGAGIKLIKEEPLRLTVYIVINASDAAAASKILTGLSNGKTAAGNKASIENGLTGEIFRQNFIFITGGEKITAEEAAVVEETFVSALSADNALTEKICFYGTAVNRSYAIEYANKKMLSLLDRAVEKLDRIELDIIDDDNCDLNFHFMDAADLAAHYEVLVGYKEIFGCFLKVSGEAEKLGGGPSAGVMGALASELWPLADKIEFKMNGNTLSFTIPELKKYQELNDKLRKSLPPPPPAVSSEEAREKSCAANMRTIEGACELFLMEASKVEKPLEIDDLVKGEILKKAPVCPAGGVYTLKSPGGDPKGPYTAECSEHKGK